ncbi:hypothetical protein [Nannocystis pusilla]|uniref:hypothetical protein n=1 Tax=Nannocystis pusilla TaxID=889268 RepID=UPI003B7FB188
MSRGKGMRSREHESFRREATFHAAAHALTETVLEADREATARREEVAPGVHVLHGVMSPKECKRLIAAAEAIGFTHAGLAIGDDTYRVNLAARNNLRVVFDAPELAEGLWQRIRGVVGPQHEGTPLRGLNFRFRVYRYEVGMRFSPHVDVRTAVPLGETRESLVIFLNAEFEGGTTRFSRRKTSRSAAARAAGASSTTR